MKYNFSMFANYVPVTQRTQDNRPDGYSDVQHTGNDGVYYVPKGNLFEIKTINVTKTKQLESHVERLRTHPLALYYKGNNKPVSITFVTLSNNTIHRDVKKLVDNKLGKQFMIFSKIIHVVPRYRMNNNKMEVDFGIKSWFSTQFHPNSKKVNLRTKL